MLAICTSGRCPCHKRVTYSAPGVQNAQIWPPSVLVMPQPTPAHIGGSARVIRARVDHSAHHLAASSVRAASSASPGMSHTTFTVPLMNEPSRRYDIGACQTV
jgi:hypothetical protein